MRMALFAMVEMTISAYCHGSGMNEKNNISNDDDDDDDIDNINSFHSVQSSSTEERKKMEKAIEAAAAAAAAKTPHTHSGTVSHEMKCVTVYSSTQKIESETKSTE